ncbi:MAG: hypothetical protein KJT03_04835 [Verrucomicrobiae bacterium]|nr:hypothetical protein [Verrucomicrobiae bacterium]
MRNLTTLTLLLPFLILSGCISVKTHSTIDPIYMTLDVNLKVQLQQELNDFFGEIDAKSKAIQE